MDGITIIVLVGMGAAAFAYVEWRKHLDRTAAAQIRLEAQAERKLERETTQAERAQVLASLHEALRETQEQLIKVTVKPIGPRFQPLTQMRPGDPATLALIEQERKQREADGGLPL